MFEHYTEPARRSIFFAHYEANRLGSPYIEPEHLLLGLMRHVRLPGDAIRSELRRIPVPARSASIPDSPDSQALTRAFAHASEEAGKLGHRHIGPEHLLLGLMAGDPDSRIPALLRRHEIDPVKVLDGLAFTPGGVPLDPCSLLARVLQAAKTRLDHLQGRSGGGEVALIGARPHSRRSSTRFEDGVEIVETHHYRDGIEIILTERFRLSEDGKTLSYTHEVAGPGNSEQHTIDFQVG
jgi:hypothetical protein